MPKQNIDRDTAPAAVSDPLRQLGANIANARLRRNMTLEELASKAGISKETASRVEAGRVTTSIGAYAAVLWVLGLAKEIADLGSAERDREGAALAAARLGYRARPHKVLSDDF